MNCAFKRADAILSSEGRRAMLSVLCMAQQTVSVISSEVTILENCGCVLS